MTYIMELIKGPIKLSIGEIIWVKVCHRRTDRQTNSLTPHRGVCRFFLSVKFATSLLASLAGGLKNNFPYFSIVEKALNGLKGPKHGLFFLVF